MRRRKTGLVIVLLAVFCTISAIASASLLFPYVVIPVTVDQLSKWPNIWVGKTVVTTGNISVGIFYVPEEVPPFNCIISSSHADFGVQWRNSDYRYDNHHVLIIGIVRYREPDLGAFFAGGYYIEAEAVINTNPTS